ncbi:hypothetical protein FIBSPDRAFT_496416 [Athelia psychrophila]|uniref:Uncharacterized protein n=1 Tax=Athelia psychrophila TaxID=1759441 RepID=A0A166KL27_9AGAM|nr:hypothetical protein FIBSPDRAFT_496416 [Fibularhizoctonia sp. CBS 109695]
MINDLRLACDDRAEPLQVREIENKFCTPQSADVRSPWPALKTLVNHGYLRVPVPSPSSAPCLLLSTFTVPCRDINPTLTHPTHPQIPQR